MKPLRVLLTLILLSLAEAASATNYTLWIHGRTGGGAIGRYGDFAYWGTATADAGVNKKAVNWDGRSSIASQSLYVRNALDCFCTGANWCYVATHSAGDLLMGYTLAHYGGSTRPRNNESTSRQAASTSTTWGMAAAVRAVRSSAAATSCAKASGSRISPARSTRSLSTARDRSDSRAFTVG